MITPQEAKQIRLRIIAALETRDETSDIDEDDNRVCVDIDSRVISQIFTDDLAINLWCQNWNITYSTYSIPHTRKDAVRSNWYRFKKPSL